MLIIREEQIQHFIAVDDEQLVEVISGAIRRAKPERVADYDDEKLAKMVKIGIERARSHELTKAEDIAAYTAVMFEISPRFDEQEDIRRSLADTTFPPDARFYQLFESISDEAWQQAEQLYESKAWFPAELKEGR